MPLLTIESLSVSFQTGQRRLDVVDRVSLTLEEGKTLSLVGESGCGKSVTASSVMRLLPFPQGMVTGGRILFNDRDLLTLPQEEIYALRGGSIAMIFQEPMTALNPVHTAGRQIEEVLKLHRPELDRRARASEVIHLLTQVGIPAPEERRRNYPFQLSGGMRQRVMIAMALAGRPRLLIADEPTTALDVTVQAQILTLIKQLQTETGMAVLYITHDMGVVADVSDDVAVMYAGQIVEKGSARAIFHQPRHPYTQGLIASLPSLESTPRAALPSIPGTVPSPADFPGHCRFADRCPLAAEECRRGTPEPVAVTTTETTPHTARCYRLDQTAPAAAGGSA